MNLKNNIKLYSDFYGNLNKNNSKKEYEIFFDENSIFEDPFQRVVGVEEIYSVFKKMFDTLSLSKFYILDTSFNETKAFIQWKFEYQYKSSSKVQFFVGISIVTFNENNKIISHIDYWDAANNIYEKIPLLGSMLRFIKKKFII